MPQGRKIKGRNPKACIMSLDKETFDKFKETCNKNGLDSNLQIEIFMKNIIDKYAKKE